MFDFDDTRWVPIQGYRPHELDEFDAIVDRERIRHQAAAAERLEIDCVEEDAALD